MFKEFESDIDKRHLTEALITLKKMFEKKDQYSKLDYNFDFSEFRPSDSINETSPNFLSICAALQDKKIDWREAAARLGFERILEEIWASNEISDIERVTLLRYFPKGLEIGFYSLVQSLSPNTTCPNGYTLLHYLAMDCNLEYLRTAKEKYTDGYGVKGPNNHTLLHAVCLGEASLEDQRATVDFLLEQREYPLNIDDETSDGKTTLMLAAEKGNEPLCKYLKHKNAEDLDKRAERDCSLQ